MPSEQIHLSLEKKMLNDIKRVANKRGYSNVQEFTYDLLHHAVYGKKHAGGRPKQKTYDDIIMRAITKPTAKSRKLEAWAKKRGIWR